MKDNQEDIEENEEEIEENDENEEEVNSMNKKKEKKQMTMIGNKSYDIDELNRITIVRLLNVVFQKEK